MKPLIEYCLPRLALQPLNRLGFTMALGLVALVGCSDKNDDPLGIATPPSSLSNPARVSSEPPSAGKTFTVAALLPDHSAFSESLLRGMQTASAATKVDLTVAFADSNPGRQAQQLDSFCEKRVDAILLYCVVGASPPSLERANAERVPVFTLVNGIHSGRVISHIASDDHLGGQLAAQKIAQLLGNKGKVLLLHDDDGEAEQDRISGFREEISRYPAIKITPVSTITSPTQADAICATSSGLALSRIAGFRQGAKTAGAGVSAMYVGYGGDPAARAEIQRGLEYKADVAPQPDRIGEQAIFTTAAYIRGEKVDASIKVAPEIVDAVNLDRP